MHVLVVLTHPNPTSFSHAVAAKFIEGVEQSGHTAELADLHAEDFDPRWSMPDLAQFEDAPMPDDVLAEQGPASIDAMPFAWCSRCFGGACPRC